MRQLGSLVSRAQPYRLESVYSVDRSGLFVGGYPSDSRFENHLHKVCADRE